MHKQLKTASLGRTRDSLVMMSVHASRTMRGAGRQAEWNLREPCIIVASSAHETAEYDKVVSRRSWPRKRFHAQSPSRRRWWFLQGGRVRIAGGIVAALGMAAAEGASCRGKWAAAGLGIVGLLFTDVSNTPFGITIPKVKRQSLWALWAHLLVRKGGRREFSAVDIA